MPPLPRVGSLEVAEDPDFERKSWRIQRVGWSVMALIVLAALAGLFGSGPLSHSTERAQDGTLAVEYERFARRQAPTQVRLSFGPEAVKGGELRVWLDRGYVQKTRIEPVVPQPQRVELGPDRLTYVFAVEPGAAASAVTFHLEFETFGFIDASAGVGDSRVRFRQLVYP